MLTQAQLDCIRDRLKDLAPEFEWTVGVRDDFWNVTIRSDQHGMRCSQEISAEYASMMFPPRPDPLHEAYEILAFTSSGNRPRDVQLIPIGTGELGKLVERVRASYAKARAERLAEVIRVECGGECREDIIRAHVGLLAKHLMANKGIAYALRAVPDYRGMKNDSEEWLWLHAAAKYAMPADVRWEVSCAVNGECLFFIRSFPKVAHHH